LGETECNYYYVSLSKPKFEVFVTMIPHFDKKWTNQD